MYCTDPPGPQGDRGPRKELTKHLLYPYYCTGCENWQLTSTLVCQLEYFQGERIGRRILKLTPYHSTYYSSRIALQWPSVAARILSRKLNFILRLKLMDSTASIASKFYNSSDPLHLSLSSPSTWSEIATDRTGAAARTLRDKQPECRIVECGRGSQPPPYLHNKTPSIVQIQVSAHDVGVAPHWLGQASG